MTHLLKQVAAPPSDSDSTIKEPNPSGMCQCGCGEKTGLATYTHARRQLVKGKPLRFVRGHHRCMNLLERFWSRVIKSSDPNGCWVYTPKYKSATKLTRHKKMAIHNLCIGVHRFSYELHYGPVPDGIEVCHTCDNPPCVRPEHLFLGTHLDNMHDRDRKERSCKKLTHEDAKNIIRLHQKGGISCVVLAAKFGVSDTMIGYIVNGVWHKEAIHNQNGNGGRS